MRRFALSVKLGALAGTLIALAGAVPAAYAQDAQVKSEVDELRAQVNQLERRIDQLQALDQQVKTIDHKLDVQQQAAAETARTMPVVKAGPTGFFIQSPDKHYSIRIGGYFQADGRFYLSGDSKNTTGSEFLIRRARPILEGSVGEFFDFRFMPDFGQGATLLEDAYGDVSLIPKQLIFRAGKFKEPVGLERLQDDRYLMLVERAFPNQLVPDRDIGAAVHGTLLGGAIDYAFGVFNGVSDNVANEDADTNDSKDFAGRLFFHPFVLTSIEAAQKFGVGIGGSYGSGERKLTLDGFKSPGQATFFTYAKTVVAAGDRYRYDPQFNYYYGPLGVQGEYVFNTQTLDNAVAKTPFHSREISNTAWQLAASYLLTGEDATPTQLMPRDNFDPFSGGFGAWEVVARVSQLQVDRDAFVYKLASATSSARRATEWALGVNWYLNPNVKFQTDYENTTFVWGDGKGNRRPERAILSRFQLAF